MLPTLLSDVSSCLRDPRRRVINICVLLFALFLPFNAFGFTLSGFVFQFKATKVLLLLGFVLWMRLVVKKQTKVMRAPGLYFFLGLVALANFTSVLGAADVRQSLILALLMVPYSLLVFFLTNVLRDRHLLRASLACLAVDSFILGVHSLAIYLKNDLVFHTRFQHSIVGNEIAQYLAYALILCGAGLLAVYLREKHAPTRVLLGAGICLWLFVSILPAVKIFHLVTMVFFLLLIFLLPAREKIPAGVFFLVFIVCFVFLLNIVTIRNFFILKRQQTMQAAALVHPGETGAPSPPDLIVVDTTANAVKNRWAAPMVAGSFEIRARGVLAGIVMGLDHPFLGIGIGETARFFDGYSERVRNKALDENFLPWLPLRERILNKAAMPHSVTSIFNIFINAFAETGLPGFIGLIGLVCVIIGSCVSNLKKAVWLRHKDDYVLPVFFSLFVGLLLGHQTFYLWMHPWLWTVMSITYAASRKDNACESRGEKV